MNPGFNLNLEQKQQLVMTPRLQTAIEILQYNAQELEEYIKEEVEENPLLEIIDSEREMDYKEISYESKSNTNNNSDNLLNYENYISYPLNLYEYLERQLFQVLSASQLEVGKYIVGNLDNHGFLLLPLTEIADKFNISVEKVVSILKKIQYLDPIGVGARDVQESLLIQLENLSSDTTIAKEIVKNYMDELVNGDYRGITKKINVRKNEIISAVYLIKTLNPYPVTGFSKDCDTKYIIPDIIIKKVNGEFVVISNEKNSFRLKISPYYYQMLKNKPDSKTHDYLEKKYKAALWLIKSIEQRRMTIFRIAQSVIEKQKDFFNKGIKYMVIMTMEEIAEAINMHESTVSRATTGKYIQTPHGLFEFKFFFSCGIKNISSISIKAIISEYIKSEDPTSPLSDNDLQTILKKEKGIDLSRRTVAKYRSQMKIPSSQKRRKKEF